MNKSKVYMIVSITVLAVAIIVSGATYAWYTWSTSSEDETKIVTNLGAATVFYDAGSNIEGISLKPVSSKENGIVKGITIKADRDTTYKLSFNLYLDVIQLGDGLKDTSFKYALYKGSTVVKEGNFSSDYLTSNLVECTTNSTSHIVLLSDETITSTTSNYTLYIWIDGTMDNPNTMQNQTFNFKLHADGGNAVLGEIALVDHITNLYTSVPKTEVTNNNITYNYATSVSLMNDRLGGTTSSLDGGNIRYYGASPNNYIYFNCSDYANQSADTCELWRIIGVFDDKVKIIRNESIGRFAWDNKPSGTGSSTSSYGSNDWTDARLMMLLNPGYETPSSVYSYEGSLYWNSRSGTCYSGSATKSCDFTSTGLKNDTTRNMIAEVSWNLGGWNSSQIYSNQIYSYERGTTVYSGRSTSWTGKIGLMYPSDYGYATDFNSCTANLYNYDTSGCYDNDWLYNSAEQWSLTPYSGNSYGAWYVSSLGEAIKGHYVFNGFAVWPILYLNSELTIGSGDGSSGSPYSLSVI